MVSCPRCGKPISEVSPKFCPYCGENLQAEPIAPVPITASSTAEGKDTGEPILAQASGVPAGLTTSKKSGFSVIADEIRSTPPNILATFAEVMNLLSQTNKMEIYLAIKKQIERTNLILDYGFFSVAETFVGSRIAPGDIVMYSTPVRLQSNDVVLTCWPDKELGMRILHMVASSFGPEGVVEVRDSSGKKFQTTLWYILGRVVYTIEFDTPAWREMVGQLMPDTMLTQRLQKLRELYEKNTNVDEREKKILELERRLTILSNASKASS
ncbi:MAG: zinc ribbon domain-containing protein [Nitrososphaerales archaeon]